MPTAAEVFAKRPPVIGSSSESKSRGLQGFYQQEQWTPSQPLIEAPVESGVARQPEGRLYTLRGLQNRLGGASAMVREERPNAAVLCRRKWFIANWFNVI